MSFFGNLKIRTLLYIGFGSISLIAMIEGFIGFSGIRALDKLDSVVYEHMTVPVSQMAQIAELFQRARVQLYSILIETGSDNVARRFEAVDQVDREIARLSAEFKKLILTDKSREMFGTFERSYAGYVALRARTMELIRQKSIDEARTYAIANGQPAAVQVQGAVDELLQALTNDARTELVANDQISQNTYLLMGLSVIVGLLLSVGIATVIGLGIAGALARLTAAARKIAEGDTDVAVAGNSARNEVGELVRALGGITTAAKQQAGDLNRLAGGDLTVVHEPRSQGDVTGKSIVEVIRKMNEVLNDINTATNQVAAGSAQIADGSQSVAQGATEQTSTIRELSDLIDQVGKQSAHAAVTAQGAREVAQTAKGDAELGNQHMREMLSAMAEISQASGNIARIVKLIDEIAFQTNILALNAAVEAAHAGQQGKGFAVVAEEVRHLAAKSAGAAGEIADMISGSLKKTEEGRRIADQTADSLQKIVAGISRVSAMVGGIAAASQEQAKGITRITKGIGELSQVVQSNSATAEQSAAASQEMAMQSMLLREKLQHFKLKRDSSPVRISLTDEPASLASQQLAA